MYVPATGGLMVIIPSLILAHGGLVNVVVELNGKPCGTKGFVVTAPPQPAIDEKVIV